MGGQNDFGGSSPLSGGMMERLQKLRECQNCKKLEEKLGYAMEYIKLLSEPSLPYMSKRILDARELRKKLNIE